MSGRRRQLCNRDFLVRNVVRDYCAVYATLAEQRRRFERDGTFSYTALRSLLGEATCKGVFWRLKDTAHHLFRNHREGPPAEFFFPGQTGVVSARPQHMKAPPSQTPRIGQAEQAAYGQAEKTATGSAPGMSAGQKGVASLIDWCIGYAFHECAKLREDAFQAQHYANRLLQVTRQTAVTGRMCTPLLELGGQTTESAWREISRIMRVLEHGLSLLARYLKTERHNPRLARWLASEETLARKAFGDDYEPLLASLFGDSLEPLYVTAARDFLDAGRLEPAAALLAGAEEAGRLGREGRALLRKLNAIAAQNSGYASVCAACGDRSTLPCLPWLHRS